MLNTRTEELTYPAVIEPNGCGGYGVYFPDLPGCGSYGDSFEETLANGREALKLHIYGMQEDDEAIPDPSGAVSLSEEVPEGCAVSLITAHPDRMKRIVENKQ